MAEVGITYTVIVQAPDILAGETRPWYMAALVAGGGPDPLATSRHHDLDVAADEIFSAIRADIRERMDRGIQYGGPGDAPHEGAGSNEHLGINNEESLTEAQIIAWCRRVDELLAAEPEINAHQMRNQNGEFAFSPASCPLCKALAALEAQARREILDVGVQRG